MAAVPEPGVAADAVVDVGADVGVLEEAGVDTTLVAVLVAVGVAVEVCVGGSMGIEVGVRVSVGVAVSAGVAVGAKVSTTDAPETVAVAVSVGSIVTVNVKKNAFDGAVALTAIVTFGSVTGADFESGVPPDIPNESDTRAVPATAIVTSASYWAFGSARPPVESVTICADSTTALPAEQTMGADCGWTFQTPAAEQSPKLGSESISPARTSDAAKTRAVPATMESASKADSAARPPGPPDSAWWRVFIVIGYRALSGAPPPRCEPASTIKISPVMRSAPSKNQTAAWAMCSGVPAVFSGVVCSWRLRAAS